MIVEGKDDMTCFVAAFKNPNINRMFLLDINSY